MRQVYRLGICQILFPQKTIRFQCLNIIVLQKYKDIVQTLHSQKSGSCLQIQIVIIVIYNNNFLIHHMIKITLKITLISYNSRQYELKNFPFPLRIFYDIL